MLRQAERAVLVVHKWVRFPLPKKVELMGRSGRKVFDQEKQEKHTFCWKKSRTRNALFEDLMRSYEGSNDKEKHARLAVDQLPSGNLT